MKQTTKVLRPIFLKGFPLTCGVLMMTGSLYPDYILQTAVAMESTGKTSTKQVAGSSGQRTIEGVVVAVRGDLIEVEIHQKDEFNKDLIMSRFLTLDQAEDRGLQLNPDDKIAITVNSQNLVVDFYPAEPKG